MKKEKALVHIKANQKSELLRWLPEDIDSCVRKLSPTTIKNFKDLEIPKGTKVMKENNNED